MEFGAPFGGFKCSGIGRELGPEGLEAYLEPKTINLPMGYEPRGLGRLEMKRVRVEKPFVSVSDRLSPGAAGCTIGPPLPGELPEAPPASPRHVREPGEGRAPIPWSRTETATHLRPHR